MNVLVLGAGVSGLTCAVKLLEAGARVVIWAKEPPERTTSAVAAALWYPFAAFPEEKAAAWAVRSLVGFRELAEDPATGVVLRDGIDLFSELRDPPRWANALDSFHKLASDRIPSPYADGMGYTVPVIETPLYLSHLHERIEELGGVIELRTVGSPQELVGLADAVVNCTGLGAGELFGDGEVFPIRGQVVRVAQRGIERVRVWHASDGSLGYVVPRSQDVVLGTTSERGVRSLEPDEKATARILDICRMHEPRLAESAVLEVEVGLRPGRTEVRLELDRLPDGSPLVHNYGHGGAGITLSIGCAEDVAALVMAAGDSAPPK